MIDKVDSLSVLNIDPLAEVVQFWASIISISFPISTRVCFPFGFSITISSFGSLDFRSPSPSLLFLSSASKIRPVYVSLPIFKDIMIEGYSEVKSSSNIYLYKPALGQNKYPPAYPFLLCGFRSLRGGTIFLFNR